MMQHIIRQHADPRLDPALQISSMVHKLGQQVIPYDHISHTNYPKTLTAKHSIVESYTS